MNKIAYVQGRIQAMKDIGFLKLAETDEPNSQDNEDAQGQSENPAEMLADIFGKANIHVDKQTPDNKTKPSEELQVDKATKWGPPLMGTGGEMLERNVDDFHLPTIGSV